MIVLCVAAAAAVDSGGSTPASSSTPPTTVFGYAGPDFDTHSRALRAHLFASYDKLSPPPNMIKYFYNNATGEAAWTRPNASSPAECPDECETSNCKCGEWHYGCGGGAEEPCGTVKVGVRVISVVRADTSSGLLELKIWYRLQWKDARLSWDPSEFGGIDALWLHSRDTELDGTDAWLPDVMPFNTANGVTTVLEPVTARVRADGKIFWSRPGVLGLPCEFEGLEQFPLEEELTCSMRVGGWHMSGKYMQLEPLRTTLKRDANGTVVEESVGFDYYAERWSSEDEVIKSVAVQVDSHHETLSRTTFSEWTIKNVLVRNFSAWYSTSGNSFPELHYRFKVVRGGSNFYVLLLIWPQVILGMAAVLVYYMPVEGGERIGLCVTLFLAVQFLKAFLPTIVPLCQRAVWIQLFNYLMEGPSCLALLETIIVSGIYYQHKWPLMEAVLRASGRRGEADDYEMSANVQVYRDCEDLRAMPGKEGGSTAGASPDAEDEHKQRALFRQKLTLFEKLYFLVDINHDGYISGVEACTFMSFVAFHLDHDKRRQLIRDHLESDSGVSFVRKGTRTRPSTGESTFKRRTKTDDASTDAVLAKGQLSRYGFITLCLRMLDDVDLEVLESAAETYSTALQKRKDEEDQFWSAFALRIDGVVKFVVPPIFFTLLCIVLSISPHADSGPNLLHWELKRPGWLVLGVIFAAFYLAVVAAYFAMHKRLLSTTALTKARNTALQKAMTRQSVGLRVAAPPAKEGEDLNTKQAV